ncbi:MAG: hypothetical protein WEC82_00665, partial [Xanthobacteraceae bacterium]
MSGRRIAVAVLVLAGWGGAPAWAQEDLTEGKTPAQLFASDCVGCHRSAQGLAKMDPESLPGFLRVHYTASKESAGLLAEYLLSLGAPKPASTRAAQPAAKPVPKPAPKPEAQQAVKPETEPAKKPESEPAAKPEAQQAV